MTRVRTQPHELALRPARGACLAAACLLGAALPAGGADRLSGAEVYDAACVMCHGQGSDGAPRIGDAAAWRERLAQGREVLAEHVLRGYSGRTGYMPAKGGRVDLSDEEILAAMDYLLRASE